MKLLQRLPDATKEEVRNQIIVLLNQMTATNEEMKHLLYNFVTTTA